MQFQLKHVNISIYERRFHIIKKETFDFTVSDAYFLLMVMFT